MIDFEYIRPSSLKEACELIGDPESGSHALAGGTDLLVQIKKGTIQPKRVISLRDIPDLTSMGVGSDGGLALGAMTPLSAIEYSHPVRGRYSAIADAAGKIGSAGSD